MSSGHTVPSRFLAIEQAWRPKSTPFFFLRALSCCRHYYLLDLCYYGNILLMLHVWVWPRSYLWQRSTFALNTGPLTFTILAFRNSLVYHDMVRVCVCVCVTSQTIMTMCVCVTV